MTKRKIINKKNVFLQILDLLCNKLQVKQQRKIKKEQNYYFEESKPPVEERIKTRHITIVRNPTQWRIEQWLMNRNPKDEPSKATRKD